MNIQTRRTFDPLSVALLILCLLLEGLFIRQYGSVTAVLRTYDALSADRSGLISLIAGIGPMLPFLLIMIAGALIGKEILMQDTRRTVLINAVTAAVLLALPFMLLASLDGALRDVIHQIGR